MIIAFVIQLTDLRTSEYQCANLEDLRPQSSLNMWEKCPLH